MSAFNIGIDTGGTYTDAVVMDTRERKLLASAKALTTRGDLSLGVLEALQRVLAASRGQLDPQQIGLVSLSTTLATNALVEGKGSAIAVILLGFDDTMLERTELKTALPAAKVLRIAGGHQYDGSELAALDETSLLAELEVLADSVEAYAVAGVYSVRNASHERRVQALIQQHTGCPVTASCDLSEALNGPRRALTAAFNARIIAMIVALIHAVQTALQAHGILAPLMVVKGDGSLATAAAVMEKPIETILSGPAASVIGANFISGLKDFIISDIGGTTTDVAIVCKGWPALNDKGAKVGLHRTMVKAIDMRTIGLGGDSEVAVDPQGKVSLQANRVVPVSLIGARWPSVAKALQTALSQGMGLGIATLFLLRPEGFDPSQDPSDLTKAEKSLLAALGEEPLPWTQVVSSVSDRRRVLRFVERGLVQLAGFTPSDAAHVLGRQAQWSKEVAELACLMIGRSYGKISYNEAKREAECQAFAQEIFEVMVAKSVHVLLESLAGCSFAVNDPLVSLVARGHSRLTHLQVSLQPSLPLVAVGGPAPVFYGEVGQRLGAETLIPTGSEVANAIGAAMGLIRVQAVVSVGLREQGGFTLHHGSEPLIFMDASQALAEAKRLARQAAEIKAQQMAGQVLETKLQIERLDIPGLSGDLGLISASLTAECLARPLGA
ncbi:hydantoinase/oxoprolinase N-terminal domain-containing protein [Thiothrix eikelboomii]|uniref:hydantoinase/oxoprolinase N-terminal domain-containing protein n=1 Tax=Thiothrix eikelboomii TaxID=92487 RepID=UPI003BB062C4